MLNSANGLRFFMGPCVVESPKIMNEIGKFLRKMMDTHQVEIVMKASYDKANRTSINSYRGIGMIAGLNLLRSVSILHGLQTITDVHTWDDAKFVAQRIDWLQIPAMLMRQTDLVTAVAEHSNKILVKKSQSASAKSMAHVIGKIQAVNPNTLTVLCERGSTYGGNGDLVCDFRNLGIMSTFAPVCYDATHTLQIMSGAGDKSAGHKEYALPLARAAVATSWVDYVFAEIHPRPSEALSDSATTIDFETAEAMIKQCKQIWEMNND